MPGPGDHERIPDPVPPLPLPEFGYDDLEKGERIGTGGDADVYYATVDHEGYTYPVAVKEPRFEGTIQKRVVERFQTEAETWSNLNDHDNIVSVYAWGTEPLPWLALEYMDGGTLDAKIGSVEIDEALWLAGRIAEGIRYGHRHGVAHLDIKPTNVLLRDTGAGTWDYPKVSDWGLAKMLLEHSNSIEGISPTYAAPEQFDADEFGTPDDITDIYQLGVVVYALLAGEPPFTGSSTAVMQSVLQEEPTPPSKINPEIPATVDDIVLKALAKQKSERYEDILIFRRELDRSFEQYIADRSDEATPTAVASERTVSATSTDEQTGRDSAVSEGGGAIAGSRRAARGSGGENGGPSVQSAAHDSSGSDSSVLTRRRTLGVLGLGAFGVGAGLLASAQMNGDGSSGSTDGSDGGTSDDSGNGVSGSAPTETTDVTTPTKTQGRKTTTARVETTASIGRMIKMGILMGVTGGLKSLGPPIRQAAELAVMDVNDADTPFTVDTQFEDTGTKPAQGVSGGEALANAGYPMICGALSSEVSLQVANNVSIPGDITQCSPASTSPRFTTLEDNDYFFRTPPHDALQGEVLAEIAAERMGNVSTSTLFLNNAYGQGLSDAYASAFEVNHGGTVTNKVSFAKSQSSYTSQIQNALGGNPDVMLVIGYPESGVQLFKDFYSEFDREDMDILVPDGLKDNTLPRNVGFNMSNVKGTAPTAAGPGRDYFNSTYQDQFDAEPGPFTWQSYDAAAVLMLANAAAGENNGQEIRDNMRKVTNPGGEKITPPDLPQGLRMAAEGTEINYQGVSGPVTFDNVGDQKAAVYEYFRFTRNDLSTIENITYNG